MYEPSPKSQVYINTSEDGLGVKLICFGLAEEAVAVNEADQLQFTVSTIETESQIDEVHCPVVEMVRQTLYFPGANERLKVES